MQTSGVWDMSQKMLSTKFSWACLEIVQLLEEHRESKPVNIAASLGFGTRSMIWPFFGAWQPEKWLRKIKNLMKCFALMIERSIP